MEPIDVSIKWPFKWCLVGSSGSGKTNFALQIVRQANKLFDQPPSNVIIIYKEFQKIYNQFNNFIPTKCFNEEDVDLEGLTKNNRERLLIICDDLYFSNKLPEISEHFLIKARHRNISWLVLTQSIFNNTSLKNISRNSTHITLFKSVRLNEPHIFFSQLRPKANKVLQDIYGKATENSYTYLDIDLSQTCPDKYRYKSNIFDKLVTVYIIMSPSTFKSMYLISKHDFERNSNRDFKLSLENKDLCDGGVNVSIKPVKNRQKNDKYIHPKNGQLLTENSPSHNNVYFEKSEGKSDEIFDIARIGQKVDEKNINQKLKQNIDSNFMDENHHHSNSNIQNKEVEKTSNDDLSETGIIKKQEYAPIYKPKMKSRTLKRSTFRQNNASTRNMIKFKSKKNDPRIAKSKGRLMLKNQNRNNVMSDNSLSHNDEQNASSAENIAHQYPYNQLEHNSNNLDHNAANLSHSSKNLDHKSDNIDNQKENDDDKEMVASSNSLLEKANGQDQWVEGLKSKLNDRRVQFKRKRDTVGYRINPETDDIAKSLVTPSDFKFLKEADSDEYLSKWKSLKMDQQKPYSIKRFKPYS